MEFSEKRAEGETWWKGKEKKRETERWKMDVQQQLYFAFKKNIHFLWKYEHTNKKVRVTISLYGAALGLSQSCLQLIDGLEMTFAEGNHKSRFLPKANKDTNEWASIPLQTSKALLIPDRNLRARLFFRLFFILFQQTDLQEIAEGLSWR